MTVFLIWLVGFLLSAPVFGLIVLKMWVANEYSGYKPDAGDTGIATVWGVIAGLFWPLSWVIFGIAAGIKALYDLTNGKVVRDKR